MEASADSLTLPFLAAVCALLFQCATRGEGSNSNPPPAEITYGGVTNGIRAGITVRQAAGPTGAPAISVFVTNSNPGELFQAKDYGTNWLKPFLEKVGNNDWLYYMATNSFCGPVELRDAKGRSLPLLKPEVSRPEAYPPRYSLSADNFNRLYRNRAYLGPGIFPLPLLGAHLSSELVKLDLAEHFDLKEPGDYELTVWPKIYKRISKTSDLCERIDVPPVSVTLRWESRPSK
jgi:hypothetical protein